MKTWEKLLFYGMLWAIYARVVDPGVESTVAKLLATACGVGVLICISKES